MRSQAEIDFIYSDGSGDILPANERSAKWKAEAQIDAWVKAKPCVTFINTRGTSDILPYSISGAPAPASL